MTAVAPLPLPELPAGAAWLARAAGQGEYFSSAEPSDRRLLLLTAAYPPRTEVGAARWEGFTPFLASEGWGLDAIIEHPRDLADPDWGRLNRLPADVRVAAVPRRRARWHMTLLRLRAAFRRGGADAPAAGAEPLSNLGTEITSSAGGVRDMVRDVVETAVLAQQSRQCAADFVEVAMTLLDARHRVVVSSGPPHYVHVAASRVAARRGLPLVVDLRDPWQRTVPARFAERLLPDVDLRDEEGPTLARAALIITNTDAAARTLAGRFPALRARILCIPNGSDLAPVILGEVRRPERFQIAHVGTLYLDRDPRPFLRAVGRFRAKAALGPNEVRVVFMGVPVRIDGRSLAEHAADAGLGDVFEHRPHGTRDEARELLRESSVGVAFQGETRTQVPAKVFEYMAFPLRLLALVGADSATAELLAGTEAIVHDIDDEEGTERSLERCYAEFRAGVVPRPVGHDGRFSRERQAHRLIDELHRLVR